ncbi:hypothetical protein D3C76_1877790 [compost metagenome]
MVIRLNRNGSTKIMMLSAIIRIPKSRDHGVSKNAESMATIMATPLPRTLFKLKKKIAHTAIS